VTCVAAARSGGKVVVGADSAGVNSWSLHLETRADEKVFKRQDASGEWWGFGFTSSFRMGDLLRYKLELPEVRPKEDLREFIVTRLVEQVRKTLAEGGYRRKHDEVESGGTFLVVFRGEIFKVEDDFQVGQLAHHYAAVGCGDHLALGAMYGHSLGPVAPEARALVWAGLHAAEQFSAGVRSPFHYIEMEVPVLASGTGPTGAPVSTRSNATGGAPGGPPQAGA
jgi:hypothetical protein